MAASSQSSCRKLTLWGCHFSFFRIRWNFRQINIDCDRPNGSVKCFSNGQHNILTIIFIYRFILLIVDWSITCSVYFSLNKFTYYCSHILSPHPTISKFLLLLNGRPFLLINNSILAFCINKTSEQKQKN